MSATAPGEGQFVDISMADGALSWLALVAARYFCERLVPRRGKLELAGGLVCYRPYRCRDGYVTLGALEPKFWQAWCRGVGREDLIERQFDAPGSETHAEVEGVFMTRTRAEWASFAERHDCCLEPVLRPRRGARVGARPRARDDRRDRSAGRGSDPPARRSDQAVTDPGSACRTGSGARRAHRARCSPPLGLHGGRGRRPEGGRGRRGPHHGNRLGSFL